MTYAEHRLNMVDRQLKTFEVFNKPLLNSIGSVEREVFFPDDLRHKAYIDSNIVFESSFFMRPMFSARALQLLTTKGRLLIVGGVSLYEAVVMTKLGYEVDVVTNDQIIFNHQQEVLKSIQLDSVTPLAIRLLHVQSLTAIEKDTNFLTGKTQYEAIFIYGAIDTVPNFVYQWLVNEGQLITFGSLDQLNFTAKIKAGYQSNNYQQELKAIDPTPYLLRGQMYNGQLSFRTIIYATVPTIKDFTVAIQFVF